MSRSRRQSQPSEITLRLILSSLLWPDRLFSFAVQICIPQMDLKIKCTVNFLSRNSKLKFLVTQKVEKSTEVSEKREKLLFLWLECRIEKRHTFLLAPNSLDAIITRVCRVCMLNPRSLNSSGCVESAVSATLPRKFLCPPSRVVTWYYPTIQFTIGRNLLFHRAAIMRL